VAIVAFVLQRGGHTGRQERESPCHTRICAFCIISFLYRITDGRSLLDGRSIGSRAAKNVCFVLRVLRPHRAEGGDDLCWCVLVGVYNSLNRRHLTAVTEMGGIWRYGTDGIYSWG